LFTNAPPVVAAVQPASGPSNGGTVVTISGNYLQQATGVDFSTVASPQFEVVSADELSAVSPPSAVGSVDVAVTSLNAGRSSVTGRAATWRSWSVPQRTLTCRSSSWHESRRCSGDILSSERSQQPCSSSPAWHAQGHRSPPAHP
jgi:hypothetical protein